MALALEDLFNQAIADRDFYFSTHTVNGKHNESRFYAKTSGGQWVRFDYCPGADGNDPLWAYMFAWEGTDGLLERETARLDGTDGFVQLGAQHPGGQ